MRVYAFKSLEFDESVGGWQTNMLKDGQLALSRQVPKENQSPDLSPGWYAVRSQKHWRVLSSGYASLLVKMRRDLPGVLTVYEFAALQDAATAPAGVAYGPQFCKRVAPLLAQDCVQEYCETSLRAEAFEAFCALRLALEHPGPRGCAFLVKESAPPGFSVGRFGSLVRRAGR